MAKSKSVDAARSVSEITTAFRNLGIILVVFIAVVTIAVSLGWVPNPIERLGFGSLASQDYSANSAARESSTDEKAAEGSTDAKIEEDFNDEEGIPKYYGKVMISHAKCVDAIDPYGFEQYRVDIAGNVNASVGAFLGVSTNPISGHAVQICPSWSTEVIGGFEYCKRYKGDPNLTTWTFVINDFSKLSGDRGIHIYVTAMVLIVDDEIAEGYRVVLDQATYDIACID